MSKITKYIFILLSLVVSTSVAAEQRVIISGVVVDERDQPIIAATVADKTTLAGVVSDMEGRFALQTIAGHEVEISSIGYQSVTIDVKDSVKGLKVVMAGTSHDLEEIVVTGYGSMKRSDLTGSIASVSAKQFESSNTASVVEAIAGQMAGVQIVSSDGSPGGSFSINIRGVSSVNVDTSPLYIVDGFEVDNIDHLTANDIKSIDVMKDASSSAIYGSRAANGVVLVTTKSGEKGKLKLTFNASASYREITKKLDVLSPYEFVLLQSETDGGYAKYYDPDDPTAKYTSAEDYIGVEGIDWQDEMFKPTWSQNYYVSAMGGGDKSTYNISASRMNVEGIFNNSGYAKTTVKANFTQKFSPKVTFAMGVNYINTCNEGLTTGTVDDSGLARLNMLVQVLSARPTGGLQYTDAEMLASAVDPEDEYETSDSEISINPIVQTESVDTKKVIDTWISNASLTANIIKGLTFKTAANYNLSNTRNDTFYNEGSREYRTAGYASGSVYMAKSLRAANYNNLTYSRKIDKHSFSVMLGEEINYNMAQSVSVSVSRFSYGGLGTDYLDLGATTGTASSSKSDKTTLSFFSRANYNYDNRYLFTATIRADGSSAFSKENRWGYFPSFSAAWRVSREKFMKGVDVLSDLKIRAGWGVVGNDRISNNYHLGTYISTKYSSGTTTDVALVPSNLQNEDLKWESSMTTDLGVDVSLFDHRLRFTIDLFNKRTKDLLMNQTLSSTSGFTSQYQNIGQIENKGLELSVNTVNIERDNFRWTSGFNISFIRNKLISLDSGVTEIYLSKGYCGDYIARVGESLGSMYGYAFDGVYQYSDFNITSNGDLELKEGVVVNENLGTSVSPGDIKYKDINGDGVANSEDRTIIGNGLPKFYGGFTNTFYYKGIDLNIVFQYNYGNDVLNSVNCYMSRSHVTGQNKSGQVADRWTTTNASDVPSRAGYVDGELTSQYVEDGSFLRFKTLTLGYSLPKELIRKVSLAGVRFYVSGENLFCWTKYSGYDPEVNMGGSAMTPSLDWGAYPKSRVLTMGVELKF